MNRSVKRKLEMAARVREFTQAHPLDDPAEAGVIRQFEEDYAAAQQLVGRFDGGIAAARAAKTQRKEIRSVVHFQLLRYLTAVGGKAAQDKRELSQKFRLPPTNCSNIVFLTSVKGMLAVAQQERELLAAKGMGKTLLDDLVRLVGGFEASANAALAGQRDHIGALADLEQKLAAIQEDVRLLDGIYRYYFGKNPDVMAEWEAVRFLPAIPEHKPDPGPEGGVAPAA